MNHCSGDQPLQVGAPAADQQRQSRPRPLPGGGGDCRGGADGAEAGAGRQVAVTLGDCVLIVNITICTALPQGP